MRLTHATNAVRVLLTTTVTASIVVLGALPASAAPPSNDTIDGARAISAVPFSETVDTTEATTDAEDARINATCGAPATNGSIWYTLTATASAYLVDVSRSNFTAGVIVATGTPGNLTLVDCGPSALGFAATAGTTYFLMAFSDNPDVVGGQLAISVTETSPPPVVTMTIDQVGQVDRRTGVATIGGTYVCDGQADFMLQQGRLSQRQGETYVVGDFEQTDLKCGGTFPWSAEIVPQAGMFRPGLSASLTQLVGCNALGCNFYEALDVVHLRAGGIIG